ncbi:hypothetical protein MMC18_005894 [Xylographa bjoerkii]|nr:hypothetical protein [Xylographa bjoerkii]
MSTPRGPRSASRGGGRTKPRSGAQSRGGAPSTRAGLQGRISSPAVKENGPSNTSIRGRANTNTGRSRHSVLKSSPLSRVQTAVSEKESWRDPTVADPTEYKARMGELWNSDRGRERKDAIRNGLLSDPDKPTSLANAITPVGTCQDMCPEYERVQRISHHGDVDDCEKTSGQSPKSKVPYEDFMVKKFKRSSPGDEQQLPSDIRPPLVLQKTLNHLFDSVIGGSTPFSTVHKFVWDRTRSIRNDFSIQQVTKTEDLRLAIDCFERMARFHILSLHQLSYQDKFEFDAHQEQEQLNNTLLSLMYYYDDSRSKLTSRNEAEFRAYCIIFEIQSHRPDVEDRAQCWPNAVLKDPRVQIALKIHAAAANTSEIQGPLQPRIAFSIAQANYGRFWSIVGSNAVSYLMACTAEIYFNTVRSMALDTIWRSYRRGGAIKLEDWIMSDVMEALGFDTEEQATTFCEEHGFTIGEREDGNSFLNLSSVSGRSLIDSNPRREQIFSKTLVEQKRLGRTFSAVINGLNASQARLNGLVEESHTREGSPSTNTNDEPLFVTDEDTPMVPASANPPPNISVFASTPGSPNLPSQLQNPITQGHNPTATMFNNGTAPNPFAPASATFPLPGLSSAIEIPDYWERPFGQPPTTTTSQPAPNPFTPAPTTFTLPGLSSAIEIPDYWERPFGQPPTTTTSQPAAIFAQAADTTKSTFVWPTAPGHNTPSSLPVPTATTVFQSSNDNSKSLFNRSSILKPGQPTFAGAQVPTQVSPFAQTGSVLELQGISKNNPVSSSGASALATPFVSNSSGQTSTASPQFFSQPAVSASTISPTSSSSIPGTQSGPAQSSLTSNTTNPAGHATTQEPKSKLFQTSNPFSSATTPTVFDKKPSALPSYYSIPPPSPNQLPAFPHYSTPISSFAQHRKEASNSGNLSSTSTPLGTGSLNFVGSSSNQTKSSINQSKAGRPKPDRRPEVLDQLANAVVCGNNGILQQFIEHIIHPTIVKSISKVKRERERAEIARARGILLGRKFLRRWKEIAWKRGLMRKGKERRKNFAQSMQALSRSTMQALYINRESQASHVPISIDQTHTMRPPERPTSSPSKRKSLPNGFNDEDTPHKSHIYHGASQYDSSAESSNMSQNRPIKRHHKRSSTIDSTSQISSSGVSPRAQFNPMSSFAGGMSLLSDSVLKKARRLVPAGPTDTTRTDYFRLKAMGIDPNTPVVPATRKRRISDEVEMNPKRASLLKPVTLSTSTTKPILVSSSKPSEPSSTRKSATTIADDSDEELFAQVRQVKAAMSESMSWYREERQKSELSRSSSVSHERPAETAAERRLRELKHTPSRTEIRLRETGARGLLPKDWGARKRTNGTVEVMDISEDGETPTRPRMGFAAVDLKGMEQQERNEVGMGAGASADDAIEL